MCAPSPPPPPDYRGAAVEQGAANKEAAISSSRLNNPNVSNPFGTQTWTEGSTPDSRPMLTQTFSPGQQALYDQSLQTKQQIGQLGTQGATALQGVIGKNLDLSGTPAAPSLDYSGAPTVGKLDYSGAPKAPADYEKTRRSVIDAMMGRANEDYSKSTDQANSDLIAAGIRPGTKAYADRQQMIERSRNDARQQAEIAGGNAAAQAYGIDAARRTANIGETNALHSDEAARRAASIAEENAQFQAGTQSRKNAIAELLAQRQTPLNEVTALMSGSQVSNPFAMPGASQSANIAPAPMYDAAKSLSGYTTDMYNSEVASANSDKQAMMSMAAMAAMMF